jgi:hypothetical protein
MSAIVVNGTTYSGGANPQPPSNISEPSTKIGVTLVAASGVRHFMSTSVRKHAWTLSWENANATTRAAVDALHALNTTFTYVDEFGTSNTVQCEDEERKQETAFTTAANTILYDLEIVLHQAN